MIRCIISFLMLLLFSHSAQAIELESLNGSLNEGCGCALRAATNKDEKDMSLITTRGRASGDYALIKIKGEEKKVTFKSKTKDFTQETYESGDAKIKITFKKREIPADSEFYKVNPTVEISIGKEKQRIKMVGSCGC